MVQNVMIQAIEKLAEMTQQLGGWAILLYVIVGLVALDYGIKLFDSITKRLGISTKHSRREEEQKKKIQEHDEIIPSLKEDIERINESLHSLTTELKEERERSDRRERNKLRDRLLQSYRYYTNPDKNPTLSWSDMESESFWQMFKDYEELLGDGYMHTTVQPAMNELIVIRMDQLKELTNMMNQRK